MRKPLENILKQLGLIEHNAVFFKEEINGQTFHGFSSELQKKFDIIKPDAYFIFNLQPFVLFFDLSSDKNTERESEIHKQVWSFDNAPVIFIIKNSEVQVFNAFNYNKKNNQLEEIKLSEEERNERFSFWNLLSGFTWKHWFQQEYLEKVGKNNSRRRANQQLFENIKQVREALTNPKKENNLSDDEANTLILRLIFIRYLIDRDVNIDEKYISGKNIIEKRISFCGLIENPFLLNQLFDKLNVKFNGVLFKTVGTTLSHVQAKDLANVFKGEKPEIGSLFYGFDFYFEIFDFSIIPVEVISGIYESIIDEETRILDSAVYTPSFLVEYILNDTVEKYLENNKTSECKIFDPSVGSGIFLVQSLRRMIDKEIKSKTEIDQTQFSERIREIAKNNLFGIDTNLQALKVTCFSIYIALLDYQEPKDIDKYEFPNLLGENLFHADFFDEKDPYNEIIKNKNLNFILGNPPWKSDTGKVHKEWLKSSKEVTGRYEIAQSFLLRSKDFMQPHTRSALIVTSTIFYNIAKTNREFKNKFLTTFCIDKFFDLSPVRRLIFEEKNSPASIVYYRLSNGNEYLNNIIKHQSIKSNRFLKHYKMLVIEKYDQKEILQRHFIENDWMFKVALYGNTLDFHFLKRIIKSTSLKIGDLLHKSTFYGGAGIERGKEAKFFPELIGLPIVENNHLIQDYFKITTEKTLSREDAFLSRGRNIKIFQGAKIIFKEQNKDESELLISYTDETFVFRKGLFSISSENANEIKYLFSIVKSNLYTYYIFLISCAWAIATRPAVRFKDEFLSFLLINQNKEKQNELVDLINKFIQPYKEHYEKFTLEVPEKDINTFNKINEVINELYGVKGYEKDLIDYVLDVSRYQFQESKQNRFTKAIDNDISFLEKYADVYITEFALIYPSEYLQIEVYPLEHFIAMNFVLLKEKPSKSIIFPTDKKDETAILKRLANNLSISKITNTVDPSKNLFIQKDIKGFEDNSFYVIKPNEYKCWHRAMACYDVAEFKDTIETAELKHLKGDVNGF